MAGGETQEKPIHLFYSYSHDDEDLRKQLEDHLAALRWSGLISEWHDRNITLGDEWAKEIDTNLSTADIILLLVSASFLASRYCWSVEMTGALERHDRGEAKVIPVILRPCAWHITPFAKLQAAPTDARPVTSWSDPHAALNDVASKIERTITDLQQQRRHAAELAQQQVDEARRAEEQRQRELQQQRDREAREQAEAEARRAAEARQQDARRQQEKTRQPAAANGAHGPQAIDGNQHRKRQRLIAVIGVVVLVSAGGALALRFIPFTSEQETTGPKPQLEAGSAAAVPAPLPASTAAVEARKPLSTFSDCTECPEMVVIPAGSFMMGSPENEKDRDTDEGPQHRVTIAPFAISKTEVTFAEWDACVTAGGCNRYTPSDEGWGHGNRPVINVSWTDAQAYVVWLSQHTGKPYRLPSEAEWEYAARAGTTTRYAYGDAITPKDANYADSKLGRTTEVMAYPPNAWGLYDMHGNVWEWVEDVYHASYDGAPNDGSAWTDNEGIQSSRIRVDRGGSWYYEPRNLRSAYRYSDGPDIRNYNLGFRVARTLD